MCGSNLFINHPHGKYDGKLTKRRHHWKEPDDVLEALFGLCRKAVENEPLKIFMVLNDLDRNRAEAAGGRPRWTGWRVSIRQFGSQYAIFNECPGSRQDRFCSSWIPRRRSTRSGIRCCAPMPPAPCRRWSGCGRSSAARAALPADKADATLLGYPHAVRADQESPGPVRRRPRRREAAAGRHGSDPAAPPQDRHGRSAGGRGEPTDVDSQTQVVQEMIRILEAQRVVSLNTIFDLADNLESLGKGEQAQYARWSTG